MTALPLVITTTLFTGVWNRLRQFYLKPRPPRLGACRDRADIRDRSLISRGGDQVHAGVGNEASCSQCACFLSWEHHPALMIYQVSDGNGANGWPRFRYITGLGKCCDVNVD